MFYLFLNDRSENNYLSIYSTDFCNLFTEWKRFGCRWLIWIFFPDISWDIAMATNFVENGKLPSFVALAFWNGMGYCYLNVCINSVDDVYNVKILWTLVQ